MRRVFLYVMIFALSIISEAAFAQDFSADVVTTSPEGSFNGKIFVTKDKVRMEMPEAVTITRMDRMVSMVLMPQEHMYMEQKLDPAVMASATEKVPGEIGRVFVADEMVDGKNTKKYRVTYTSAQGETAIFQWVDPTVAIPIKTAAVDGSWSTEFRNVSTAVQDAALFEVPEGYQKFSVPNMAEMTKAAMQASGEEQ